MAKSRRWNRYQPPERRRTESGRKVEDGPATPVATTRPKSASKPTPPSRPRPTSKATPARGTSTKAVWWSVLASLGVLVAVIAIVAAARGGDGASEPAYATETLDEAFIADGLQLALDEAPEGSDPVGFEINEYEVRVEFFDPNRDRTTSLTRSTYDVDSDGYRTEVRDSYYDDYAPRPIDLDLIVPADVISAAETALAEAEDPYSWSVVVSADYDTGVVSMVADAYGDESAEITTPLS